MFYAMGHFSKFVAPGDRRISSTLTKGAEHVQVAAFQQEANDAAITVILLNKYVARLYYEYLSFLFVTISFYYFRSTSHLFSCSLLS